MEGRKEGFVLQPRIGVCGGGNPELMIDETNGGELPGLGPLNIVISIPMAGWLTDWMAVWTREKERRKEGGEPTLLSTGATTTGQPSTKPSFLHKKPGEKIYNWITVEKSQGRETQVDIEVLGRDTHTHQTILPQLKIIAYLQLG